MARIPSQDATIDQAHASTSSAEAKHPTHISDETSDTEWPNIPARTKEKHQSPGEKGTRCQKCNNSISISEMFKARCQQDFNFVQTVCQAESSNKFKLVEVSGIFFDSTESIAQSISAVLKLAAGVAKQIREEFPTTYHEFGSKASKEKFYGQKISPNRFISDSIVKPRFWNKPTYSSLHAALKAIL